MNWQDSVTIFLKSQRLLNKTLAYKLGMSEATLSRKLRKKRGWTVDELINIGKAFNIRLEDLLNYGRN